MTHDNMGRMDEQTPLEAMIDTVRDEVAAGDHDRDLWDSVFIDGPTMARVARMTALDMNPDDGAIRNLNLQITDFINDLAERRIL